MTKDDGKIALTILAFIVVAAFFVWCGKDYTRFVFEADCNESGYFVLPETTRIKCTVEKLEWEKPE